MKPFCPIPVEPIQYSFNKKESKTMKTKEKIINILKKELPFLKEKYDVKKIGVFGSYSKEIQDEKSDVDILVEFESTIGFFDFIMLEDYLTAKLGLKVDLVTEDALKPIIKPYVMKEVMYV